MIRRSDRAHLVRTFLCAAAVFGTALPGKSQAQAFVPTYTEVPSSQLFGSLDVRAGTVVTGLNDRGQFVGNFGERNWVIWGVPHAFIYGSQGYGVTSISAAYGRDGSLGRDRTDQYRLGEIAGPVRADPNYHYLDLAPAAKSEWNAQLTTAKAINDAGIVVGSMTGDVINGLNTQDAKAFVWDSMSGAFSSFAVSGAVTTIATGINNSGQIVGNFTDVAGLTHGFLLSNGTFSTIDDPAGRGTGGTFLGGISDNGVIVGTVSDVARSIATGFVLKAGVFTDFNINGNSTYASDVNDAGQIVGWVGVSGIRRGFVSKDGVSTILDFGDGGASTYAYTINNAGTIGGVVEGRGGFLAAVAVSAVPEPASWLLLLIGCGAVGLAKPFGRARAASCSPLPATTSVVGPNHRADTGER